jgi:hypothetical protein
MARMPAFDLAHQDLQRLMPVWLAVGLAVIATHYVGYVDPPTHPSKTLFLQQPIAFAKYLLVYLDRPFAAEFILALPIAVAYLGIHGSCRIRYQEVPVARDGRTFAVVKPGISAGLTQ